MLEEHVAPGVSIHRGVAEALQQRDEPFEGLDAGGLDAGHPAINMSIAPRLSTGAFLPGPGEFSATTCSPRPILRRRSISAWTDHLRAREIRRRAAIGATDPAEAAPGTVRKLYAESKGRNAIHASDSDENAAREIGFFFSESERIAVR